MSTIREHHTALAAVLNTIDGLRVSETPTGGLNFPFAYPQLTEWEPISFDRANHKRYVYEVLVFTATSARPQDGYLSLMDFADYGASSVAKAIWDGNDRPAGTFSSLATTTARVVGFRTLGSAEVDAFEAYGGVFTVEILTKG